MDEKFIFDLSPYNTYPWWENFTNHCLKISIDNSWLWETVVNRQLLPYGARLIEPKTYHPYLRFDRESDFTMCLLRWS